MRFSGLLVLLVCIGLVVLAITNPQPNDFRQFADEQLEERFESEAQKRTDVGSGLGRLLAGAGAGLAGRYVERATNRRNYVILSTYTVDLDGTSADKLEWKFLGIGGRFVPLETPESDDKNGSSP